MFPSVALSRWSTRMCRLTEVMRYLLDVVRADGALTDGTKSKDEGQPGPGDPIRERTSRTRRFRVRTHARIRGGVGCRRSAASGRQPGRIELATGDARSADGRAHVVSARQSGV